MTSAPGFSCKIPIGRCKCKKGIVVVHQMQHRKRSKLCTSISIHFIPLSHYPLLLGMWCHQTREWWWRFVKVFYNDKRGFLNLISKLEHFEGRCPGKVFSFKFWLGQTILKLGHRWQSGLLQQQRSQVQIQSYLVLIYSYRKDMWLGNFLTGPWWWSGHRPACLLLWWSEFKSCWSRPLFVHFVPFTLQFKWQIFKLNNVSWKYIDGVLGTWTWGGSMEGTAESTELWRHPD